MLYRKSAKMYAKTVFPLDFCARKRKNQKKKTFDPWTFDFCYTVDKSIMRPLSMKHN